jgi:hypothetical protein
MAEGTGIGRSPLRTLVPFVVLTIVAALSVPLARSLVVVAVGGAAVLLLEAVRVPAPSGDHHRLGIAAVVAMPLVLHDWWAMIAAASIGLIAWTVIGVALARRGARDDAHVPAQSFGIAAFIGVTWSLDSVAGSFEAGDLEAMAALLAGAFAWFVLRALVRGLLDGVGRDNSLRYEWLLALEDWPVALSMFTAGALFGFGWPAMRWWAFPVALLPYAFGHLAFVRYHGTRVTYGQTIRALAQIPEVAGLAPSGHATRTAGLAVAIGRDLGMHPDEVFDLEYAALMHDIGRITLNEPAILKAGYTDDDVARWGAQIIAESPYLTDVAELVRRQHRNYRSPGVVRDEDVPLISRIIKVASAYDEARNEMQLDVVDAMERLHRGSAYDFDPEIVASLRRVLTRVGDLSSQ